MVNRDYHVSFAIAPYLNYHEIFFEFISYFKFKAIFERKIFVFILGRNN